MSKYTAAARCSSEEYPSRTLAEDGTARKRSHRTERSKERTSMLASVSSWHGSKGKGEQGLVAQNGQPRRKVHLSRQVPEVDE